MKFDFTKLNCNLIADPGACECRGMDEIYVWESESCSAGRVGPPVSGVPFSGVQNPVSSPASVVTNVAADLSSENPIRPARIHEDHRQQEQRADQQEALA